MSRGRRFGSSLVLAVLAVAGLAGCEKRTAFLYPWQAEVQEFPAPEKRPTCHLTPSASVLLVGDTIRLSMEIQGNTTEITLNAEPLSRPTDVKEWVVAVAGAFVAEGIVRGAGGMGTCSVTYEVRERPPTCLLEASPAVTLVGDPITLTLKAAGKSTVASIGPDQVSVPVGQLTVAAPTAGTFTTTATVQGPGGSGTCQVTYEVKDRPPTCTLTASAASIVVGDQLDLLFEGRGKITSAAIEGTPTTFPKGQKAIQPPAAGTFTANATVVGPGGSGLCQVTYEVREKAPACTLAVLPKSAVAGGNVVVSLTSIGKTTEAYIDGTAVTFPTGQKTIAAPAAGKFNVGGEVRGPGGTGFCQVSYEVLERPPTCTLVAKPKSLVIGAKLDLVFEGFGKITVATVEGNAVQFPQGQVTITPAAPGKFTATAEVTGPGGKGTCTAKYQVLDAAPTCTLTAVPNTVVEGDKLDLVLDGQGKMTSAVIEGTGVTFPKGTKTIQPATAGSYTAKAEVRGPGGTGTCQVTYQVTDKAPACTLTVSPKSTNIGGSLTASLAGVGKITAASIDGKTVTFPAGSIPLTPTAIGAFKVAGEVKGPGGTGTCEAGYDILPAPPACTISVTPTFGPPGTEFTISMKGSGTLTSATIDGSTVNFPDGQKTVKPSSSGKLVAKGEVKGPGGTANCDAPYSVTILHQFNKIVKEIAVVTDIDILWVIDNSGSMSTYQKAVQDNMDVFIQEYTKVPNLKWKMGLISTDESEKPYLGFTAADLFTFQTPSPVKVFNDAIGKLGTSGSSTEKTFTPVMKTLDGYVDFLRANAGLAVISVTDAPEQSNIKGEDFLKYLEGKKGDLKKVFGYGIFGATDLNCAATDDTWTYKGSEVEKWIVGTAGKVFPICDKEFGKSLLDLAKQMIQSAVLTPKLVLAPPPIVSTIQVRYKGTLLPAGPKATGGYWIFQPADNSILFHDLAFATGLKEEVEITYQEAP